MSARCKNIRPTAKHERLVCRMLCGMDAIEGAGLLIHGDQQLPPRPRFLGTCFAFGDGRTYLTAAHCVPADDEDAKSVYLMRPSRGGMRQVLAVRRHPTADLAVLHVNPLAGPTRTVLDVVRALRSWRRLHCFRFP